MRKHLLLASFIALFCLPSNGQISKGSTFLGGSISYSSGKTEQGYTSSSYTLQDGNYFVFSPAIGKAIRENLILGIELSYLNNNQTYGSSSSASTSTKTKRIGGGPFVRSYYPLGKNFYAFGQAGLGYQHIDETQTSTVNSYTVYQGKGSSVSLVLYPGLAFAVTRKFYLDLALSNLVAVSYQEMKNDYTNPGQGITYTNSKSFSISSGLYGSTQFSIGARFILGNK